MVPLYLCKVESPSGAVADFNQEMEIIYNEKNDKTAERIITMCVAGLPPTR